MKRIVSLMLVLVALLIGETGFPEEQENRPWKDEAELAVVNTTGNTDVFSLYFKNQLQYIREDTFVAKWTVGALTSKKDGETSAERYETEVRFDHFFDSTTYAYLAGGWLKDRFAGFDNRVYIGPGGGYRFFSGPHHFLTGELGANYTMEDYIVADAGHFAEGRVFGKYEYVFNDSGRFEQGVEFLQAFDDNANYKINSMTAVTASMTRVLSLKVSYEVRYQNRPRPADLEKTDTIFGAALVLTY